MRLATYFEFGVAHSTEIQICLLFRYYPPVVLMSGESMRRHKTVFMCHEIKISCFFSPAARFCD